MLEEIELEIYNKYIKQMVKEENGVKRIFEEDLEKLSLSKQEKNFINYIINKQKVEIVSKKVLVEDRNLYVDDNDYSDINENNKEPVMSKMNEKKFEDYSELDEYLETRFIPTYVLLKQRKKDNGKIEHYSSIRLHHILSLKLSDVELGHVMNYLKIQNICVEGNLLNLEDEFDNYDCVTKYKENALPQSVPASVTSENIKLYKQNNDQKLREQIITDNMRLVPYVAKRYAISTGIDINELCSYGYEGLILALDRFDVSGNTTFSTYAISYIRGNILNGIPKILNSRGNNFYYNYINAKTAIEKEYAVTLKEAPELIEDVVDLLAVTGKIRANEISKEQVRAKILALEIGNESLDDEETIEELIASGQLIDTHDYSEEVLNTMSRSTIEKLLETIPVREAEIIRLKFGFYDGKQRSFKEVGEILNIGEGRVGQLLTKAFKKLEYKIEKLDLKEDLISYETEKYSR